MIPYRMNDKYNIKPALVGIITNNLYFSNLCLLVKTSTMAYIALERNAKQLPCKKSNSKMLFTSIILTLQV